jgi:succinate dehydrogenase/fumarate reductase cytochrome b subunit
MDDILDTSKWNMAPKYRRRRAVAFTVSTVVVLVGIWFVATQVWWTGGGYCIGDIMKCLS